MAKGVRMADIAEKLGISIVSVSKALAGKDGVSEEMRAKILSTAEELGYRSPAAKATATQQTGGQIIGVLVADHFFNENTFYSNLYRALLRAGINRKSVMLTVGYPPLPFCLDAGSRRKLHRAGSRLYSSTGFVLHTLGLPLWGDYGEVPAKDLLFKKGATCLWQSSN